ncbi:hypothetical protein PVAR5_0963 [Paecilomyces variotii No. 5]|uniref:Uncharacterized protein n=1 Tax=Byssochlamys spectabilis (strain No. 5 / NBRC 109023) TaxID=1356009 RepID=V5FUV7_BYSSN|nr:hypothetical protein PVAR5_0963 [Paecilomyces variotii No. 5]
MTGLVPGLTLLLPTVLELRIVDMARQAVYAPPRMFELVLISCAWVAKTSPGLLPVDRPQIGGGTIPERGSPGRIITEAETAIEMTTAVGRHAPHLVVGEPDTEIVTGKDIGLQAMTVAAEATVGAAVLDEAVHTMATKARK